MPKKVKPLILKFRNQEERSYFIGQLSCDNNVDLDWPEELDLDDADSIDVTLGEEWLEDIQYHKDCKARRAKRLKI